MSNDLKYTLERTKSVFKGIGTGAKVTIALLSNPVTKALSKYLQTALASVAAGVSFEIAGVGQYIPKVVFISLNVLVTFAKVGEDLIEITTLSNMSKSPLKDNISKSDSQSLNFYEILNPEKNKKLLLESLENGEYKMYKDEIYRQLDLFKDDLLKIADTIYTQLMDIVIKLLSLVVDIALTISPEPGIGGIILSNIEILANISAYVGKYFNKFVLSKSIPPILDIMFKKYAPDSKLVSEIERITSCKYRGLLSELVLDESCVNKKMRMVIKDVSNGFNNIRCSTIDKSIERNLMLVESGVKRPIGGSFDLYEDEGWKMEKERYNEFWKNKKKKKKIKVGMLVNDLDNNLIIAGRGVERHEEYVWKGDRFKKNKYLDGGESTFKEKFCTILAKNETLSLAYEKTIDVLIKQPDLIYDNMQKITPLLITTLTILLYICEN